ncbi:hypothetical protein NM688_g3206 [Phlebia brevispora]|uniref:Uncharacterized protein n=1 Tax=Phlebia brevispora TaxID=194682 RepID=A0ACC1T6C1_9APHY|nr:hypothetical protein NM688_g3206 [Phlebia brevispora]
MMHDTVTTSPSPATGFSKTNISSRDILSATNGSRRPQSVGMQNADRSVLTSSSNTNGGGRWRVNGSGQLVDFVSAEWDITDDLVKLQLTESGADPKSHTVTPPQSRGHLGIVGIESSPLETSSETSIGSSNSSSPFEQTVNLLSHSRGSSADTTVSSHTSGFSTSSQALHPFTPLKASGIGESRNRPHSYSGGLSKDDLVRLSQVGTSPAQDAWYSPNGTPERLNQVEQPSFPTITGHGSIVRHEQQTMMQAPRVDDLQVDYQTGQQRQFHPLQQTTMSPPNFAYPAPLHPATISLNGGQQVYDMMLPTPPLENPTMARLQQQTPYRGGHQHSASDPASLRDPATIALLSNGMQAAFAAGQMYGPGIVPPNVALFNQFYGGPDAYPAPDLTLMNRIQPQYTGQYSIGPGRNTTPNSAPLVSQLTGSAQGGPSFVGAGKKRAVAATERSASLRTARRNYDRFSVTLSTRQKFVERSGSQALALMASGAALFIPRFRALVSLDKMPQMRLPRWKRVLVPTATPSPLPPASIRRC